MDTWCAFVPATNSVCTSCWYIFLQWWSPNCCCLCVDDHVGDADNFSPSRIHLAVGWTTTSPTNFIFLKRFACRMLIRSICFAFYLQTSVKLEEPQVLHQPPTFQLCMICLSKAALDQVYGKCVWGTWQVIISKRSEGEVLCTKWAKYNNHRMLPQ